MFHGEMHDNTIVRKVERNSTLLHRGWIHKECRQSHKQFCQSRDIFGAANVCACVCEAQKG